MKFGFEIDKYKYYNGQILAIKIAADLGAQ